MGMDVYGDSPKSEVGEYFRNNVWYWHPLWEYCLENAPASRAVEDGHFNSGDGLDEDAAIRLADELTRLLDTGHTAHYAAEYAANMAEIPDEVCDLCEGRGYRTDDIVEKMPRLGEPGGCNGCSGKGKRRPFSTSYYFDVDNVREFAAFCRASGGFKIY